MQHVCRREQHWNQKQYKSVLGSMQDTGQQMDVGQLLHEVAQRDNQIYHLQAQLRHFQSWTACLANTALQPLSMPVMLAAIQVLVSGFPDGTTEVRI